MNSLQIFMSLFLGSIFATMVISMITDESDYGEEEERDWWEGDD